MEILYQILGPDPKAASLIVLNLILIESLLSVDNAAVLATMVMDLPKEQRDKALKYGIFGAYFFRGLCLLFASYLIQFGFLKGLGGLYLAYLAINYFWTKNTPDKSDDTLNKSENKIYKYTLGLMGPFWSTVALVEVMDLAFSIDNVFAAVAFTDNIYLICIGVFIGILAMRFVAQAFVRIMQVYPFLEAIAFIVIGILGLKLMASYACYFFDNEICTFINSEKADLGVSLLTVAIFVVPILTSLLFNFPKKVEKIEE
jgi:YkoY family integral membrane protein